MTAGSPSTARARFRIAAGVLIAAVVAVVIFGAFIAWSTYTFYNQHNDFPPDTNATPEASVAGARYAGFPDPTGLEIMALRHSIPIDESWEITWRATPEAAERFLVSGGVAKPSTPCDTVRLPDDRRTPLAECQQVNDQWKNPDGYIISRTVTRGRMLDGTYIVNLFAVGP